MATQEQLIAKVQCATELVKTMLEKDQVPQGTAVDADDAVRKNAQRVGVAYKTIYQAINDAISGKP